MAELIKNIVGFKGNLVFNSQYPDGNPKKVLDSSQINKLGWKSSISLEKGLSDTYQWYLNKLNFWKFPSWFYKVFF